MQILHYIQWFYLLGRLFVSLACYLVKVDCIAIDEGATLNFQLPSFSTLKYFLRIATLCIYPKPAQRTEGGGRSGAQTISKFFQRNQFIFIDTYVQGLERRQASQRDQIRHGVLQDVE